MRILSYILITLLTTTGYSQFDSNKKSIKFAPVKPKSIEVSPAPSQSNTSSSIKYESIFDKKDKLLESVSILKKKEEEEKSILEPEKFDSPAQEYTDKMNKKMQSEGMTSAVKNADLFLGEFRIFTEKLNISCRDNGAIDGDNVAIWINGERIVPYIGLLSGFRTYTFDMKEGLNVIEIEALNTGELYPNTGQFSFIDGNGKVVTNQNWDLNSGYKAIIKIRRINGILQKE